LLPGLPAFRQFNKRTALNNGELGLALLAMASGAVLAMPIAGLLSAKIGSDRVSRITGLAYCGLLPGLVLTTSVPLFAVTLFCFAAVHGGLDVAMNAQAGLQAH
jgi:hypothetical protein